MTCVVGLIRNNEVFMGADSVGMDGFYGYSIRKDKKIYRVKNCLIGFTTSFRMGQLLGLTFSPPSVEENQDLFSYMVSDFTEAVRQHLKTYGYAEIEKNRESGGTFLVAIKNRLFTIYDDYQVSENELPYIAIGCGSNAALGSLFSTKGIPAESRIEIALQAATQFSVGVKAPFQIEKL